MPHALVLALSLLVQTAAQEVPLRADNQLLAQQNKRQQREPRRKLWKQQRKHTKVEESKPVTEMPTLDLSTGGFSGGIDFGGGFELDLTKTGAKATIVDFGDETAGIKLDEIAVNASQRERFDKAMEAMSDEDYVDAALKWDAIQRDANLSAYHHEAEYQLAKTLYRMGLLDASLLRFRRILQQGPEHSRFRKAIEWLFFASRKLVDETKVLSVLARFRNVELPKAYQDEYNYLLGKYLFMQAERLEVARMQAEALKLSRQSRVAAIDFGQFATSSDEANAKLLGFDFAVDESEEPPKEAFDFGETPAPRKPRKAKRQSEAGSAFDFSNPESSLAAVQTDVPDSILEAIRQGLEFAQKVNAQSPFYPRALYLQGLLHYLEGEAQHAVARFQDVVRILHPKTGTHFDTKVRELGFMSLARIHYGYKQFDKSLYYYDLIDKTSPHWLTALFEGSWASYRRGDYEKALGNLFTLHSPFFRHEYYPESDIVRAIIYFEACRYGETRTLVDGFIKRFTKVLKNIEAVAAERDSAALHSRVYSPKAAQPSDATREVVRLVASDVQIATSHQTVDEIVSELRLFDKLPSELRASDLGQSIRDAMHEAMLERQREAGKAISAKLEQETYTLKGLLAQALRIKIEVARAERDMLREAAAPDGKPMTMMRRQSVVDEDRDAWPYDGEFWRDELGTYELELQMCTRSDEP